MSFLSHLERELLSVIPILAGASSEEAVQRKVEDVIQRAYDAGYEDGTQEADARIIDAVSTLEGLS
jgi:hypothetical protein